MAPSYRKLYDYGSQVVYAAGAFNWKVAVGDSTRVYEFEQGQTKLAAELTGEEMTWSRSVPVAYDQMAAWFGAAFHGGAKVQNIQTEPPRHRQGLHRHRAGLECDPHVCLVLQHLDVEFAGLPGAVPARRFPRQECKESSMSKYVIYALMVTFSVTAANWVRMFKVAGSSSGSSWSSRTGSGGGSYGGGSSGGSHK